MKWTKIVVNLNKAQLVEKYTLNQRSKVWIHHHFVELKIHIAFLEKLGKNKEGKEKKKRKTQK